VLSNNHLLSANQEVYDAIRDTDIGRTLRPVRLLDFYPHSRL